MIPDIRVSVNSYAVPLGHLICEAVHMTALFGMEHGPFAPGESGSENQVERALRINDPGRFAFTPADVSAVFQGSPWKK